MVSLRAGPPLSHARKLQRAKRSGGKESGSRLAASPLNSLTTASRPLVLQREPVRRLGNARQLHQLAHLSLSTFKLINSQKRRTIRCVKCMKLFLVTQNLKCMKALALGLVRNNQNHSSIQFNRDWLSTVVCSSL